MARRRWVIFGLGLSQLAVCALVALVVASTRFHARWRAYAQNPMFRIGIQVDGTWDLKGLTDGTFESDLELVRAKVPAPSTDVFRLLRNLNRAHQGEAFLTEAQKNCLSLGSVDAG